MDPALRLSRDLPSNRRLHEGPSAANERQSVWRSTQCRNTGKTTIQQIYCINLCSLRNIFYLHSSIFSVVRQYLETFVLKGPEGYGEYCTKRLRRLKANGERKELPCWIELEVKNTGEAWS